MGSNTSSNIKSACKTPVKYVIKIGNVTLVPLDKTIVKSIGITENTSFQQEQTQDGIHLRILKSAGYHDPQFT